MKIQKIKTDNGISYVLLDENYEIVEPVMNYIRYLHTLGRSFNTRKAYIGHLKLFYKFLNMHDYTIYSIFEQEKSVLEILIDFAGWLKIDPERLDIKPQNAPSKARRVSTVNRIILAVEGFYTYMADIEKTPRINFYKEVITHYKHASFLSEVTRKRTKKKHILLTTEYKDEKYKFITIEQYEMLKSACSNKRDRVLLMFMFKGGVRLGEALGIHLCDLSLQFGRVDIVPRENLENEVAVKNHAAGSFYLSVNDTMEVVEYITTDLVGIQSDMLFVNLYKGDIGKPMKEITVEKKFLSLSRKIGLKVTPHMLRHGFATEYNNNNPNDIVRLKKLMRHRSLQSTQIYTHITNEQAREAYMKLYESKNESIELFRSQIGGKNEDNTVE